MPTIFLQ